MCKFMCILSISTTFKSVGKVKPKSKLKPSVTVHISCQTSMCLQCSGCIYVPCALTSAIESLRGGGPGTVCECRFYIIHIIIQIIQIIQIYKIHNRQALTKVFKSRGTGPCVSACNGAGDRIWAVTLGLSFHSGWSTWHTCNY